MDNSIINKEMIHAQIGAVLCSMRANQNGLDVLKLMLEKYELLSPETYALADIWPKIVDLETALTKAEAVLPDALNVKVN